jgi:hypothetical protein
LFAQLIKQAMQNLINLDFRTQFVGQNLDALLNLHPADFLFVEHTDMPCILHVSIIGTSEWIEGRFAATGNGELFAHALLQKYAGRVLTRDCAKLLAYKVIEEAIQVGAYGLGHPIDIWEVCASGKARAGESEVSALHDSARLLREREVAMLIEHASVSRLAEEGIEVAPLMTGAPSDGEPSSEGILPVAAEVSVSGSPPATANASAAEPSARRNLPCTKGG